jgi:IS30 family transposase
MERSAIQVMAKRGKSIRRIAAELGRSRTTIARVLREPVEQPPPKRRR